MWGVTFGCFGNTCTCIYLHLLCFVLFVLCISIVSFMYIYSYLLLESGILPPSENSITVNNNNNNNLVADIAGREEAEGV